MFFNDVHRQQTIVERLANAHDLEEEDQTDEPRQNESAAAITSECVLLPPSS